MLVPNKFPTQPSARKIAIIGEAPGADEERLHEPFVGTSGRFLAALLSKCGVSREQCFLGNVSQQRPSGNKIELFRWDGDEIQHGLYRLREDIETFQPNIVVLLGNVALKAAKDPDSAHPLFPRYYKYKNAQWRGSLFLANGNSPFRDRKCIASYHPAYCLRDYDCTPLLHFDLKKAVRESTSPKLSLPDRHLLIPATVEVLLQRLLDVRQRRAPVAIDIEGGIDSMSCISFATSPTNAFIVPFVRKDGTRYWTAKEECEVWRALAETLEDPNVPKVLQNSLYDRFVLHYSYGIRVRNTADDTMLHHWEFYSELEKSLGVQASLYTDEPFYKTDRKSDDDTTFYQYCCRDSAVTLEINEKLSSTSLPQSARDHYRLNVTLLNPMLYMELRGILYDGGKAKARRDVLREKLFEAQARLNALTGCCFRWKNLDEVRRRAAEVMLTKKLDRPRKDKIVDWLRFNELLKQPTPTLATIGEIENLCEQSLNVNSKTQFPPFLYEHLKLPIQYNDDKENPRPTADYEALLKLSRYCQQEKKEQEFAIVQTAIEIRALQTRSQMLSISADHDGRIRCGYNIVGSNTGRVTCYESPTGSGYNLQTIPNYTNEKDAPGGVVGDRDLFLADPGKHFAQMDLKGADGWTVAAYSAMLGDTNMLADYLAGLKPANILALILRGVPLAKDRNELKAQCKQVNKDDWDYFACKRVQHGASYLEGGVTISRNILKDSEGKLYMPPKECDELKNAFFSRYFGIQRWHGWVASRIRERPVLVAASGQVRTFFGRADEILTKAVAFEPQANTTYATNLAMFRLWTDRENRMEGGLDNKIRLRIEPLHQVHDALCVQFSKDDTAWAIGKIQSYFDNPLTIAGQTITIPFDGAYGPAWGLLGDKHGGGAI